jgi:mono/diheme cytochrome c family protein
VTAEPSQGVSCFACHVNGHTNGAFELGPDSRPNYARLRVKTPTLRGNYALLLFSSKRSIRSMDHFAEVEEYFDGDTATLAAIGGRNLEKAQTNHMGDINSIIDFPPAPKLDALNKLIPSKATPEELRGEAFFNGKAQCAVCHVPALQFTDNTMRDLKVERFYHGRPEGPIKTFSLRASKTPHPTFTMDDCSHWMTRSNSSTSFSKPGSQHKKRWIWSSISARYESMKYWPQAQRACQPVNLGSRPTSAMAPVSRNIGGTTANYDTQNVSNNSRLRVRDAT